jgi:hypothetical protein
MVFVKEHFIKSRGIDRNYPIRSRQNEEFLVLIEGTRAL